MNLIWGIVLIIFGLIAWIGQAISLVAPKKAANSGQCRLQEYFFF